MQRPHRADGAGQQHTCGSAGACAPGAHRRAGRAGSIGRARVRLGALPLTAGRSQAARTGTHVRWRSGLSWRRSFLIQHRVDGRGHSARTTPPPAPTDRRIRSAHRHCAVGLVCRRYLRRWNSHRRRRQRREDRAEVESGTDTFSERSLVCLWVTGKATEARQTSARRPAPLQLAAAWWLRTRVRPSVPSCAHRRKAPPRTRLAGQCGQYHQ